MNGTVLTVTVMLTRLLFVLFASVKIIFFFSFFFYYVFILWFVVAMSDLVHDVEAIHFLC